MAKNKNNTGLMNREIKVSDAMLCVRDTEEGKPGRTVEGYAIRFGVPSVDMSCTDELEIREYIAPEAVSRELLDGSDIKMTMFHDRQLILARSDHGKGTLRYDVDENGVRFRFEAPNTADGDKALELVRRGDIKGCSFMFSARYSDRKAVDCERRMEGDREVVTYTVRRILGIYDFTLAADPAYPATTVSARELGALAADDEPDGARDEDLRREKVAAQVAEMRRNRKIKL